MPVRTSLSSSPIRNGCPSSSSSQQPFLPFSKPTIDEATISAVGDVLALGLDHQRAEGAGIEAQLSEYFGGRPGAHVQLGTCTMEIALRIAGIGPGDEVITTPISWVATANVHSGSGRYAGVCRYRPSYPQYRPGPGRSARSRRAPRQSSRFTWPACRWICPMLYALANSTTRVSSKMPPRPWAPAGTASASAPPGISCRSASRRTRTSPSPRAAAWC